MVEISIEVRSGSSSFTTAVRAESIRDAGEIVRDRYPESDVTVVFPIDPDRFFAAEPVANLLA